MGEGVSFLQDLAIVMIIAGLVTLLFHRLKQPVVLGYLVAGFIIGPYTPPFPLIRSEDAIRIMADLGVVFLMFSLGMDFNLRKVRRIGPVAFIIAAFEILVMITAGYFAGSAFGWSKADSLFLGVMLSLTSTMIVIKSLRDRGEMSSRHAELISGVSLFEDVFVIVLMVLLPGFARSGTLPTLDVVLMLAGLFVFLVAAVVVGLLVVPRLLRYIARHATEETMLIVSLGLCFGLSLLAVKLHFSAALGAFLIGAVVAESRDVGKVESLTQPLRDMFVAVFFVAIGMQIDPKLLYGSLAPALIIGLGYMVFKTLACAVGSFLTGADARTSMRVGTNMAQLGEFAFILAALGIQLNLASEFLYPVVVAITCLSAIVRPYMVDASDRIAAGIANRLPLQLVGYLSFFRRRAAGLSADRRSHGAFRHVWSLALQLVLNMTLIASGFIVGGYLHSIFDDRIPLLAGRPIGESLVWLALVILLLPLYIATYKKMQAMAMMLVELMTGTMRDSRAQKIFRSALEGILLAAMVALLVLLTVLVSAALLPPWQTLLVLLAIVGLLVLKFGRSFNRWYSGAKFALVSTFVHEEPASPAARALPPASMPLSDAYLKKITVRSGFVVGKLIRELQLRTVSGASIVAIEREGKPNVNPGPDTEIFEGDELLLLGNAAQLEAAQRIIHAGPEIDNSLHI